MYDPPGWPPALPPQPPAPQPVPRRSRVLPVLVSIGLAVALVLSIGVVVLMIKIRADDDASVVREPVNTATNPFLPPVGEDATGVVPPAGSGGTFAASTPGLYGGTLNKASCDAAKLVEFLSTNPDKARAWASVVGIATADIGSFVSTLTSVVLRSDTVVVNHGFTDGEASPLVSALQAGTAVLVNPFGLPVVKCYCGNPLKAYTAGGKRTYTGPSWPAFNPAQVTTVVPAAAPMPNYTIVDLASGQPYTRQPGPQPVDTPAGGPTQPSASATVPPTSAPPTSEPPQTTARQAENLLRARVNACASVRYPWPPHAKLEYRAGPNEGSTWRVTITGTHRDGTVQTFVWNVDPAAETVQPVNDDAITAGQYCSGLSR
jgi:hypothetical protein